MANRNFALLTDTAQVLSKFAIFSPLSGDTLAALADTVRHRRWSAGETIFHRGDDGDHMLAITEGRIRLSLGTAQGKELVLRHLTAGDVVGELALIDGHPRSAEAVAIEPTSALVLGRDRFLHVLKTRADLGLTLACYLASLLRSTNFQMESIALHDLQTRVVRFFLHALGQIHGQDLPKQAALRMQINQSDLSAVLGASRPKINQVLQALIAGGAISRDGDRIICVVERLRRLADIRDPRDFD